MADKTLTFSSDELDVLDECIAMADGFYNDALQDLKNQDGNAYQNHLQRVSTYYQLVGRFKELANATSS